MKQKISNTLVMLMDAGEYALHIFTLAGPLVLLVYAVWHVLTVQSWSAALFIVVAVIMLAINVLMRTADDKQ